MDKNINSQTNPQKPFKKDDFKKKAGDKIEEVGKKIYNAGDKIEHSNDK